MRIDADYIYRSVYNKNSNTWFKVLGIDTVREKKSPLADPTQNQNTTS